MPLTERFTILLFRGEFWNVTLISPFQFQSYAPYLSIAPSKSGDHNLMGTLCIVHLTKSKAWQAKAAIDSSAYVQATRGCGGAFVSCSWQGQ